MPQAMIEHRALLRFTEAGSTIPLAKIDAFLPEAGADKLSIPAATMWSNIADFADFNTVWDAWVPAAASATRARVEAMLANPSIRVEIAPALRH
jgi:enamine deaminase RidA (YjgF/YER057c/UK114 family)